MSKKILSLIAGMLASALLLTALFLLLGGPHTRAAPIIAETSTIKRHAGVELSPGYSQDTDPGAIVTYTHIITNTGKTTATFTLEATSSQGWPVKLLGGIWPTGTLRLTLPLDASVTDTFVVSLTVPATATGGTADHTVVTATKLTDHNVRATVTDTTTIRGGYIYLPLVVRNYPPTWQQASGTGGIKFYDIAVCADDPPVLYAGTESGLYRYDNASATWQHWALEGRATPVVANPLDCAEAFVAVWGSGVYGVVGQNQATLLEGLDEPYLYGLAISDDGQTLYAGSSTQGVYTTSPTDVNWIAINNGIPPDDLRIRSLYIISDTLYAGGRQCTYYYSNDGGNSWNSETILDEGEGCEDAQVWAIAQMDNVLYVSLGGDKGLYQSADGGTNWTSVSSMSAVTIYRFGLRPHQSRLYVGTYGHGIYTCESGGCCQPLPNSGLGTSNIRGLEVIKITDAYPRLLAGSDDGIWWVPLIP